MALLRKVTDEYEGDLEIDILYRKPKPEVKLPWYTRFKNWIRNWMIGHVRRI